MTVLWCGGTPRPVSEGSRAGCRGMPDSCRKIARARLLAKGASAIPELMKFIVIAGLWLAAQLPAAAENFTDADADGIKEFLHATFSGTNTNTCMVIGLVDERGSKVFTAGK